MKRALLANGVGVDEWSELINPGFSNDECDQWLYLHLGNRGPAILCVDNDDHWVTVIGICQDRYIVFDPSRNQGIEVHTWESLAERWVNAEGVYYGLGISLTAGRP